MIQTTRAAASELRAVMQGRVVLPGDDEYDRARRVWNGAVDHRPALFALCESPGDVQAAVRVARAHGIFLSVRGGGHDWAGRSVCHDGLVVDLSGMRRVAVDAGARVATVDGGATAVDLIAAAAPHGLAAVTGAVGTIGMAGLTLAGGYGPLIARYGLALDNLLGAEVVLADGRLVTADPAEHPGLFWALRGGGGDFGAVTAMRVRLHPLRSLRAGLILFPMSEAASVLRGYAGVLASAPDDLAVTAGVLPGPDGRPALFLAPAWVGDPAEGERVVAGLLRLGTPRLVQVAPRTHAEMLGLFDAHVPDGRHYELRARWLPGLTPGAIEALVEAGRTRTSPLSLLVLHDFRGAAARVPADATAFGLRRDHFLALIFSAWEPGPEDDGARNRRWAQDVSRALAPFALPSGPPHPPGPDALSWGSPVHAGNADRLWDLKRRYDPDHLFYASTPPAGGARPGACRE